MVVFLSRILGPKLVGLSIVISVYVSIFETVFVIGFGPNIVQKSVLTNTIVASVFLANIFFGAIGFSMALAFSSLSDWMLGIKGALGLICVASTAIIIKSVGSTSLFVLQRRFEFKFLSLLEVFAALVANCFVCIPLVLKDPSPTAPILATIVEASIVSFGVLLRHPPRQIFLASFAEVREQFRFSLSLHLIRSLNGLARYSDKWLISRTLGVETLGLYSRASQIASSCETFFAAAFSRIIISEISRVEQDQPLVSQKLTVILRLVFATSFIGAAWICIFGDVLVLFFLGSDWMVVVEPLKIFSLSIGFRLASNVITYAARANTNLAPIVRSNAIATGLSFVILIISCRFDLSFIAIGYVIASVVQYLLTSWAYSKVTGIFVLLNFDLFRVGFLGVLIFSVSIATLKFAIKRIDNRETTALALALISAIALLTYIVVGWKNGWIKKVFKI
jgi:O-antigen/teichoic acid export membrane protein